MGIREVWSGWIVEEKMRRVITVDKPLGVPGLVRSRMIIDKDDMCERGSLEIKSRKNGCFESTFV